MYLEFHGLRERPFTQTPDPRFLYWNEGYREALASLRYGIQQRKGFIALIGEAGTGKTTLLRKLLDDLADETLSVFVFNPNASFEEILEYTLSELGISAPSGRKLAMTQRLNEFLLAAYAEGKNTVLVIDEAQDLSPEVLESLRLLSNLETAQDKILQIVLSGQPELATHLARADLRQLKQRIAVRARLERLSRAELAPFIAARVAVAGGAPDLFAPDSFDAIWEHCDGIPRLINTICDNALLVAYALGRHSVDAMAIAEVAADLAKLDAPLAPPPSSVTTEFVPLQSSPPGPSAVQAAAEVVTPKSPEGSADVTRGDSRPELPPTTTAARGPQPTAKAPPPDQRLGLAVAGLLATALLLFGAVLLNRPETVVFSGTSALSSGSDPEPGGIADQTRVEAPSRAAALARVSSEGVPAPDPTREPEVRRGSVGPRGIPPVANEKAVVGIAALVPVTGQPGDEFPPAASPGARIETDISTIAKPLLPASVGSPAPGGAAQPEPAATASPAVPPAMALPAAAAASPPRPQVQPEIKAAPGSPTPTPIAAPGDRVIVIEPGDTLLDLLVREYGQTNYTALEVIRARNPQALHPERMLAGTSLVVPAPNARARLIGDAEAQRVLVVATTSLARAMAAQTKLSGEFGDNVRLETTDIDSGLSVYRVVVSGLGKTAAKNLATRLGPVLDPVLPAIEAATTTPE